MLIGLVLVASVAVAPASAATQLATDRAKWEEAQQSDQSFYRQQFIEFGFVPIEEIDAGNRSVRRLSLRDPYGFLPIPGLEFERKRDGKVTMRQHFSQYRTDPVAVPPQAWDEIVAGDDSMFEVPQFRPVSEERAAAPSFVCHGWMALVQASSDRASSWWECRDKTGPKLDYVLTMLKTALATRPECKVEEDLRWAFQKCFGEKKEYDDPRITEAFAPLEEQLSDEAGMKSLAKARMSLRAEGVAIGSPEWRAARDAVREVLRLQSSRQEIVQKMSQIAFRASNASQRDKLKMRSAIRHWNEFLTGQNANYVEILSGLAWAKDPATAQ